jgi:hypothetical protein
MQLDKDQMVRGLKLSPNVTGTPSVCEPCLEERQHRSPSPVGTTRAAAPLNLVHSDVCGKVGSSSLSGSEYFVTLHLGICPESGTRGLKALVENSTSRKLKVLRTDNGGELTSGKFEEHLRQHGIRHETTVPKNPEQNGTAEQMNHTLMESVRSMLADSGLPQKFWAEALSTAVYLKNRSPTKSLPETTPFEVWSGEKPDVSHLRVFGCNAYSHVPRDERVQNQEMLAAGVWVHDQRVQTVRQRPKDEQGTGFQKETPNQGLSQENSADHGGQKEMTNQEGEPVEIDCGDEKNSEGEENPDTAPGPRCSEHSTREPDWFGDRVVYLAADISEEPTTLAGSIDCTRGLRVEKSHGEGAGVTEVK